MLIAHGDSLYTFIQTDQFPADKQVELCRPGLVSSFYACLQMERLARVGRWVLIGGILPQAAKRPLSYPPERGVLAMPFPLLDIKHLLE